MLAKEVSTMKLILSCLGAVAALLAVSTAGQNSERLPAAIAGIHEVKPKGIIGLRAGDPMSRPFVGGGLYRVRSASMLQLIAAAYGVGVDKVAGGPAWLAFNRYDITARLPENATPEIVKEMLQTLLADRFKLAVHNGDGLLDAWAITA